MMTMTQAFEASREELFQDWLKLKLGPITGQMLILLSQNGHMTYDDLEQALWSAKPPPNAHVSIRMSAKKIRDTFKAEGVNAELVVKRPRPTHNEFKTTFFLRDLFVA
jgi:DNA-binding SARP family transcriptional activator